MKKKIAYLGPAGTFCEEAALIKISMEKDGELIPCSSIAGVFAAVDYGSVSQGMVPIENSCEGSVNITLDLLAYEYQLEITEEIILPVRHNLLARPGLKNADISTILSHSQALAQCRQYLAQYLDGAETLSIASTAEAAYRVSVSPEPWAAIGTQAAARAYGLDILEQEIQDRSDNETRFVSLGQANQEASPVGEASLNPNSYKTSIILTVGHQPGALFKALEQFYLYNINLSKIESRPTKTGLGNYLFFIDIDGHRWEPHIIRALDGLRNLVHDLRILGSYQAASNHHVS
ncbi:MAG: prephenate dehydratase [Syntrophaceticus sp.]|jgi:prephenate dehydratase|nr:prephenate dehydratase [Syntrophaceticus sp.]MDD4360289.1 prephenate dehydratase [Syntrophaceticus sp.]MDD4782920.1 prephenate dehydratase [Syntrophaceticus sp.]